METRLNRRKLLRLLSLTPLAVAAACRSSQPEVVLPQGSDAQGVRIDAEPTATPTPEPSFVVPAGEQRRRLMAGTEHETPLYVFGSGRPGRVALALGGVHGNEPGGWLAADWIVEHRRPENGALLVVPRANRVAISLLERTTSSLGDLNRSYPGFEDGLPMERMAAEITAAMRVFHVDLVHDMHESWAFYRDRTTNGTAYLGETISTNGEAGTALVKSVIERVNASVLYEHEKFTIREFGGQSQPPQPSDNLPRQTNIPAAGRGTSSLGLNRFFSGLVTVLVEMGQQQTLERRIALHIKVLDEVLQEIGVGVA